MKTVVGKKKQKKRKEKQLHYSLPFNYIDQSDLSGEIALAGFFSHKGQFRVYRGPHHLLHRGVPRQRQDLRVIGTRGRSSLYITLWLGCMLCPNYRIAPTVVAPGRTIFNWANPSYWEPILNIVGLILYFMEYTFFTQMQGGGGMQCYSNYNRLYYYFNQVTGALLNKAYIFKLFMYDIWDIRTDQF